MVLITRHYGSSISIFASESDQNLNEKHQIKVSYLNRDFENTNNFCININLALYRKSLHERYLILIIFSITRQLEL